MDVLNALEVEPDVGVVVLVFVPLTRRTVSHSIQLNTHIYPTIITLLLPDDDDRLAIKLSNTHSFKF